MGVLLIITSLIALFIFVSALRNKVLREIGFRNIFRRKSTTLLVILGSLIGTALISGSLTLGDSFNGSSRDKAESTLGEIDAQINKSTGASSPFVTNVQNQDPLNSVFDKASTDKLINSFDINKVDGVIPALVFTTSLVKGTDPTKDLSETSIYLIAFENGKLGNEEINLNIPDGKAIVSKDVADRLSLKVGDRVQSFNGVKQLSLEIIEINERKGASNFSGRNGNIIVSPTYLRKEFNIPNNSSNILLISAKGGVFEPTYDSNQFMSYLNSKTDAISNENLQWKANELKASKTSGGNDFISYIFLGVSVVGVIAGILLIINIYSMLAEERKSEMGTLRAIALTRSKLIKTFLYEGFFYSVISSIAGVAVGIGVGFVLLFSITDLTKKAFEGSNFSVNFHTTPASWILSFCLGLLITFGTSYIASRRISKVNIVSAIRSLPDEKDIKRTKWTIVKIIFQLLFLINSIVLIIAGIDMINTKNNSKLSDVVSPESLGAYLIFIGLVISCYLTALLISKFLGYTGRDKYKRFVITAFNLPPLLLSLFIANIGFFSKVFESFLGYSLLLLSGLTIVFTSTAIITYNIDIILWVLEKTIGRISAINGIVKLSLRYSGENRFRTGLTVLMFSLVLFLVAFLSVFKSTIDYQLDKQIPKGGYEAFVLMPKFVDTDTVKNDVEKLDVTDEINIKKSIIMNYADISTAELYPQIPVEDPVLKQLKPETRMFGVDENFLKNNPVKIATRYDKFKSDDEAINAMLTTGKYIFLNPSGIGTSSYLNPIEKLQVGKTVKLEQKGQIVEAIVAGYLDPTAPQNYTIFQYGIVTSNKVFTDIMDKNFVKENAEDNMLFKLSNNGKTRAENLKIIQESLIKYNLANRLFSIASIFEIVSAFLKGSITILQGFLSFALFVGVAGIAIIMVRSVNERKQQIGMLRSLGFQRKAILISFFLEASFIIVLGILIGIISGALTGDIFFSVRNNTISVNNISDNAKTVISIPYGELIGIGIGTYIISVIFTLLPSYQASRLEPVEATNYLD
ncbi:MAG: FtsX-like permease family protein [bacterium]